MGRVLYIAFAVQAASTEVSLAFTARAFDLGVEHRQITDDAHALAAAAGARLDQQRQRDFSRTRIEGLRVVVLDRARCDREAGLLDEVARAHLVAHQVDLFGCWPDEAEDRKSTRLNYNH